MDAKTFSTFGPTEPVRLAIPDVQTGMAILARLPLANPAQAQAALHRFLDSLLEEPPAPAVYLNLLEQTRVPLCFVQEETARRYVNKALPLAELEEGIFQGVLALWRKLTRAYAHCAQLDADAEDPEHPLRVALVLQRCLDYTRMLLVEHYRARRELPPGIWLDLHGYYASAEEWGVATAPIADPLDAHGRATHCTATYVASILLDLAAPYSLSVREQTIVGRWARQWAPLVALVPAHRGEALPQFVVDLMQDAGLRAVGDCLATEELRKLDTSRLATALAAARQALAQRLTPAQAGLGDDCSAVHSRRLLEHLARPWTQVRAPRKFRRHAAAGIARVALGTEAIHYLVSGAEFSQPESARTYSRQDFDTLFAFRHMADPSAKLHIQQPAVPIQADEWEVVNQSANGFRIMRSIAGQRVEHGQLLGLCPHDGDRYLLGQVTWLMQDRAHGLIAGIAALPGVPRAIAARPLPVPGTPLERFSRAFLLPAVGAVGAEQSLVLPPGWVQTGREVEIYSGGAWRVRLDRVLQEGPDFERVAFTLAS